MANWNILIIRVLCAFFILEATQTFAYSSSELRSSLLLFAAPVAENDENYGPEDTIQTGDVSLNDYDPDGDPLIYSVLVGPTHGQLILGANGQYSYVPDPEYNGLDYATYQVCDPGGLCATAQIEFGLTFVNDLPQANNDNFNAFLGSTLNENVSWNDIELDDEVNWWNVLLPPSHAASFSFNIDGSFSYTPEAGYTGPDQFMYQACDPCGACDFAFVYITVLPPNTPPVAVDDYKYGTEDFVLNNQVHSNDYDPDGDALTFSIEVEPEHGVLILNTNGTFSFTPDLDYYGEDYFIYNACDIYGLCDDALVTLEIAFVNDWPVAVDDYEEIDEDETLTASVALNDYDLDLEILDYVDIFGPYHGTLTLNFNGTYTYTPEPNYFGDDQFGYVCIDPCGVVDFGDVFITINSVNDLPIALGENYVIDEDESIFADLSLNDSDIETVILTYSLSEQANYGDVELNSDGSFSYTPFDNYFGNDGFSYFVNDADGGSSEANVNIQIIPINDPPIAVNDQFDLDEDTQLQGNVALNDSDLDGDDLMYSFDVDGVPGSFSGNQNGEFLFVPDLDFNGQFEVEYEVCDMAMECVFGLLEITVNPLNDAPVAVDDEFTTSEEITIYATVADNDFDVDGDVLTYSLLANPVNGTIIFDTDGSFSYTPNDLFNGLEMLSYMVCDPFSVCSEAQFSIEVLFVNDAPEPLNDAFNVDEDQVLLGDVSLNDFDADGDELYFQIVQGPLHGDLIFNANGYFSYTPNSNYFGQEIMSYNACDPLNTCVTATITININPLNDTPVAIGENIGVLMNIAVSGDVSNNDYDVDNGILTYSIIQNTVNGVFNLMPNGTFTYSPNDGFLGSDQAEYQVCDSENACATAIVNFNVTNTNDAPVLTDDSIEINEDQEITFDLSSNDSDPNGDVLTYSIFEEPNSGNCIINASGILEFQPDINFVGTVTMKYQACDPYLVCEIANVTINVLAINDAPIAIDMELVMFEDESIINSLAPLSSDVDDANLTYSIITLPQSGNVLMNEYGGFIYAPNANYFGMDFMDYEVCDSQGACDIATVYFEIVPVNDAPVALNDNYSTLENIETFGDVSINDFDIDSDNLQYSIENAPQNGLLIMDADGTFSYIPDLGFMGIEVISYSVCDEMMMCEIGQITIAVGQVNSAPSVESVNLESCALSSTIVDLSLYINDLQTPIELLNISIISSSYGTYSLEEQNLEIIYDSGYSGIIDLLYLVCDDGIGPLCSEGVVHIDVKAPFAPEILSSEIADLLCFNDANGSIEIEMPEDDVNYSFEWTSGQDTKDIFNLESGIYELSITGDRICQVPTILNFEVIEPDAINIIGLEAISINDNPGGSSAYEVTGGTEPYSYLWADSEGNSVSETESLGILDDAEQQGSYTLTITDANECEVSQTILVTNIVDLNSQITLITYPNPVNDHCNIVLTGIPFGLINLDLYDMSGRLVKSSSHPFVGEMLQLDMSSMSSGSYSLQINSKEFRTNTLLLLQAK